MAKLSKIQWTNLSILCVAAAMGWAPGCTTSDGNDDDADAGAAGDDGAGGTSTSGGTSSGGAATGPGGAAGAPGGQGGAAGAPGGEGGAAGSAGAIGNEAGAGGVTGVNTCNAPAAGEESVLGDDCADYCTAYFTTCASYNTANSTFADVAECRMSCELYGDTQLCCRAYHVATAAGPAANAAAMHCPFASGDADANSAQPCN